MRFLIGFIICVIHVTAFSQEYVGHNFKVTVPEGWVVEERVWDNAVLISSKSGDPYCLVNSKLHGNTIENIHELYGDLREENASKGLLDELKRNYPSGFIGGTHRLKEHSGYVELSVIADIKVNGSILKQLLFYKMSKHSRTDIVCSGEAASAAKNIKPLIAIAKSAVAFRSY